MQGDILNYYEDSFIGKSFHWKKFENLGSLTFLEGLGYPSRITLRQMDRQATNAR